MKKTIIIALLALMTSAALGQNSKFRASALDTISQKVNLGYTNLMYINTAYAGTAKVWIKCYDQILRPNVAVDVPALTFQIGSSSLVNNYFTDGFDKLSFKKGLWIRCGSGITDTSRVGTVPASKPIIEIGY